jgi:hypothetical protein
MPRNFLCPRQARFSGISRAEICVRKFLARENAVLPPLIFIPELGSTFAGSGTVSAGGRGVARRGAEWSTARQLLCPGGTE